jgi:tetratricopeptide (TPR) repeat protein
LATLLTNLARVLQSQQRTQEAEDALHNALRIDEKCFGSEHPNIAIRLSNLGVFFRENGRLTEAEKMDRLALRIETDYHIRDDRKIAHRLLNLSETLVVEEEYGQANVFLRKAWVLLDGSHDLLSCRVLAMRIATAMLHNENSSFYSGQLKSLLALPHLTALKIDANWSIQPVVSYLERKASASDVAFLKSVFGAASRRTGNSNLSFLPRWNRVVAVDHRLPWPEF